MIGGSVRLCVAAVVVAVAAGTSNPVIPEAPVEWKLVPALTANVEAEPSTVKLMVMPGAKSLQGCDGKRCGVYTPDAKTLACRDEHRYAEKFHLLEAEERGLDADILLEPHHSSYGRPWVTGLDTFRILRDRFGLAHNDTVLDYGCGALRLGIHVIRHIAEDSYYCVETDRQSLLRGLHYEIAMHHLHQSGAHFVYNPDKHPPPPHVFDRKFTYIVAAGVLIHVRQPSLGNILKHFGHYAAPGATLVITHKEPVDRSEMLKYGFKFKETAFPTSTIFDDSSLASASYFVYTKVSDPKA